MADTAPVDVVVQVRGEAVPAGRLWSHRRRGAESATFVYDAEYLARPGAYALDPTLPLTGGQHQTPGRRALFGAFSDSAPDRWGRRLIARAERQRARRERDSERSFGEIDYLLGVRDDARQGALRFRRPGHATYLTDEDGGVPLLIDLPELLARAERIDRDEDATEDDVQTLLRAGSSLGGARPKAHVLRRDGRLAIAKFPSPSSDDWDVIAWEAVALQLAGDAGLVVPRWSVHDVAGRAVLIVDRFDRDGEHRIGYVSAMTMLEQDDGDRGSYLDIASTIEEQAPHAGRDLEQLWRRMAFSVLISNTDDHLRNHAFLRDETSGWSLSPAFDLNPNPRPGATELSTAIDWDDATTSIDLLLDVAPYFRMGRDRAMEVLAEVRRSTEGWRDVARGAGLPRTEIDAMAPAFERAVEADARTPHS
jgi:serine/threonine-protein kinase HipA